MKQEIYQVDAFTNKIFSGNPAAVCPLESWLNDDILQKIAMENNLAETAFLVKQENQYDRFRHRATNRRIWYHHNGQYRCCEI